MKSTQKVFLACWLAAVTCVASANPPETVVVGNPGNSADSTGYGAVDYVYRIGKYEVTNAEYAALLNAVAKTDAHQLYDPRMAEEYGGILRSGSSGRYTYAIKDGMAHKPVGYVTWVSCVRYANWLSNGQGTGNTEIGAYEIRPGDEVRRPDHAELARGDSVRWVLASENEWYKAAYFDPEKPGGAGYWPFAVKGGSAPECNLNSNRPSDVGSYAAAASPYGTFDQNGNVWEYNEHVSGNKVGLRGGSYWLNDNTSYLHASTRYDVLGAKWPNYGFRMVALGAGAAAPAPPTSKPPADPIIMRVVPGNDLNPTRSEPKTFYVSRSAGNDDGSGDAATASGAAGPWKTLARASTAYIPGDTILLRRGDTWNEEFAPQGSGTPDKPITIGAYGEGPKPVIDRGDDTQDRTGIYLSDQGGFKIAGIEFKRCMTGIYGEYSDGCPIKKYIWVEDCYFHDSLKYQHYEDYPRRKIGLGICFFSYERDKRIVLSDITIKNCVFRRLASGIWTNSPDNFNKNASYVYNFGNMIIDGCLFEEGYQWQQGIRGVHTGVMRNCVTHDIGRGFRSFNGVAGSMFFRCRDWVFEDSEWGFVSIGLGSGDGEAFDFEGNCDNMTMRNCLFHDTDGPGFLLCCYASDGHAHSGIVMENCVINGKSKRPIGLPRCAIVNTTDWNESTWKNCRFYLSEGETVMRVMDPERDKKTSFVDCLVKDLTAACSTPPLRAKATASPGAEGEPWIELDFGKPTSVNEFRIKEKPSSSIIRYRIECWDDVRSAWVSCFNGRGIGAEFVAPIVSRTTTKARLRLMQTENGEPGITEFTAFHDPSGESWNVARGDPTPNRVGKATAKARSPVVVPAVPPASEPAPATAPAVPGAAKPQQRNLVWDTRALFEVPQVHPAKERPAKGMHAFFYEGAQYKGRPTWVFAYYAAPEGTPPPGGWPAVVCAHGGGGTAYPEWVKKWNQRGYAAIAMDLEGHLPGGTSHHVEGNFPAGAGHPNAGPARIDWFGARDLPDREQWFYHAVADVVRAHSLLRSSKAINSRKIGLTGISWGGTIASAVAGVDPRFSFVIPVYGGGFIHESDNPGLSQWFPPTNMTPAQFQDYRTKWDPAAHLPHAKMPMLWVSGLTDAVFQLNIFEKSARAAGGPSTLCVRPFLIHGHGWGWEEAWEIYNFADSIVKGGTPLQRLAPPHIHPTDGLVHVGYTGDIKNASLSFTTSGGPWKGRNWGRIDCRVEAGEVIANKPLPAGTTAYFLTTWDPHDNLVSSELGRLPPAP